MGTSKKQKKREWLRYRDFVLSPYGVIKIKSLSYITRKVAQSAAMLGLDKLLNRKPAALSGGQRQRVALGRAIVREPQAFLLDEPLSNLDAQLRGEMRGELIKLHRRLGKTMVYVTHDQVEAMTMADRICIMRDGHLIQCGTPLEVYHYPVNTFVARFLSSPSINLLSCRVQQTGAEVNLQLPNGPTIPVPGWMAGDYLRLAGKEMLLGVRPEDFHAHPRRPDWLPLQLAVTGVEALGAESIVNGTLGNVPVIIRLDHHTHPAVGQTLNIWLDPNALHLFHTESGDVVKRRKTPSNTDTAEA